MFSFGQTDDELKKVLQKTNITWEESVNLGSSMGRTLFFSGNQTLIRLKYFPETTVHYACLQHEIFHATTMVLGHIGMRLTDESDEAYAYLIGYLTEQIYNKI